MSTSEYLTPSQIAELTLTVEDVLKTYDVTLSELLKNLYDIASWLEVAGDENQLSKILWKQDGSVTTVSDIENLYYQDYQNAWFDIDWDELDETAWNSEGF